MTKDEVNSVLGNILSINPDLIDIISSIAADTETLSAFATSTNFDAYKSATDSRLDDLETYNAEILYIDTNTGEVKKDIDGVKTTIDINSVQIQTKYKISDDPQETVVYNLEE